MGGTDVPVSVHIAYYMQGLWEEGRAIFDKKVLISKKDEMQDCISFKEISTCLNEVFLFLLGRIIMELREHSGEEQHRSKLMLEAL